MGADMPRNGPRFLCGLVIGLLMATSLTLLIPNLSTNVAAITPIFSRPNVLVDKGAGPIEMYPPGGPEIAVDMSGTIHVAWADLRSGIDRGIYYARSINNGLTWINEMRVDGFPGEHNYAPSIAVDKSGGSYNGYLYITWQRGADSAADIYVIRSLDGGNSWINSYRVDTAPANIQSKHPKVVVDTNGLVYLAFEDKRVGNEDIFITKSDDGGATWYADTSVGASFNPDQFHNIDANKGLVCLIWKEMGASSARLWISASTDQGLNWQSRIMREVRGGDDLLWPSIMVDENRHLHVAWVEVNITTLSSVVYSQSKDLGNTWTIPVKVNDVPFSSTYIPHGVNIVKTSGVLFIVWADNRNGNFDIFASWSENDGLTWGDGLINNNDIRVDDTNDNGYPGDDSTEQFAPTATSNPYGVYVIWADRRDLTNYHTYFASFEISGILITEVRDSPDGLEQIEIYNRGNRQIILTGWILDVDGTQLSLNPLGIIPPFSYRTIGDPASSNLSYDIDLNDEGGWIEIIDSSGNKHDIVSYGQLGPAPDPIEFESIERVFFNNVYLPFWTRASTPSFGSQNLRRPFITNPNVVLNEIFFNSVDSTKRYIEIFYRGTGLFDLTNYIIAGDTTYKIPFGILSNVDPYYVIRSTDAPALFNQMDVSGDNLYLYDPGEAFLDMAGWSSAHTQDTSMVRIPDGYGTSEGYDDNSSVKAGWHFDQVPTLALVAIGPEQSIGGDLGDRVLYNLTVTNKESFAAYVNIEAQCGAQGWQVTVFHSNGYTLLTDSPGDSDTIPDVGLLQSRSSIDIVVAVNIPSEPQPQDFEISIIKATISADPLAFAKVNLTTVIYPYEAPSTHTNPSIIYVENAPPIYQPKVSLLTLNVTGKGSPKKGTKPQDVVFLMDSSGSMGYNDPNNLRLAAAKHYVDLLLVPDRAAVVDFDDDAFLVNGDHLSSDYVRVKANIDTIDSFGGTDIPEAIMVGTNELIGYGNQNNLWFEILLTDGIGGTDTAILAEAQRAAIYGIVIFTIGLGDGVNENILRQVANVTGGIYLKAEKPEDLEKIYQQIGDVTKGIAGYDNDVTDNIPMINIFLPNYIHYVSGSANPIPSYIGSYVGMTNIQWNLSELKINQTWSADLKILSSIDGTKLRALAYPYSIVTYIRHDGNRVSYPFPKTYIDVLAAPPLPDLTLAPNDIKIEPSPPYYDGDLIFLNATIHNIGQGNSDSSDARFYDGLPPSLQIGTDQPIPPLSTGESSLVSVLWKPSLVGPHDICVVVDPEDLIYEVDETNNLACIGVTILPIPPKHPDYTPIQSEPQSSILIGLNKNLDLSLKVLNAGDAIGSKDTSLVFHNYSGSIFGTFTIQPLAPNEASSVFIATWKSPAVPGSYQVIANVDYYNDIYEWNEMNNYFSWTINVVDGPQTSLVIGSPNYSNVMTYITSSTSLDFNVVDTSETGIVNTSYRVDGNNWINYTEHGRFTLNGEGDHRIEWYSVDSLNNYERISYKVLRVDDTPPISTPSIGEPNYLVDANYVKSSTPISIKGKDDGITPVGLQFMMYRLWNDEWTSWSKYDSALYLIGKDGIRQLQHYSIDYLGNKEEIQSITLVVDNTPPEMEFKPEGERVAIGIKFTISADDGPGCGVAELDYSIDGSVWTVYSSRFTLPKGLHIVRYKTSDNLYNLAEESLWIHVIEPEKPPDQQVELNFKPVIALIFSILIAFIAVLSAKKRPFNHCKSPKGKFLLTLTVLAAPFIVLEALTGFVSLWFEPLRIPPLLGWGMGIDGLILAVAIVFLLVRMVKKKSSR